MNQARFDAFAKAYREGLLAAVTDSDQYAYGAAEVPKVADRMLAAIANVNFTGGGFKRACKTLGIKQTRKAIVAYLEGTDDDRARERAFREANKGKRIAVAAWGSWHPQVPDGMVCVLAPIDGRLENGRYGPDPRYFLVPKEDYDVNCFVVDETKHAQCDPIVPGDVVGPTVLRTP